MTIIRLHRCWIKQQNPALFGAIIEQNDFKETMQSQFASFVAGKKLESFGLPTKITTKS
jgi:hypothetical protein